MNGNVLGNAEIPVLAYNMDGVLVGEYESITQAARRLYIRDKGKITKFLNRKKVNISKRKAGRKAKPGVENKNGQMFTFIKKQ